MLTSRLLNNNILNLFRTPAGLSFAAANLLICSMLTSPFLLSLSMWIFVGAALWESTLRAQAEHAGKGAYFLRGLVDAFVRFIRQPIYVALSLLVLVPAASYFWSENIPFWAGQVRVRIPFFVIPFAFANLSLPTFRQHQSVLYMLVWVMAILCVGVGINFVMNYDTIIADLIHGRPVPVPRNHIRFNLLLATAILAGGWLWYMKFVWRYAWERKLLFVAVLLLFFTIHLLTVRSGLTALYMALFYTLVYVIVRTGNWKLGLAGLGLMILVPIVAVSTMPSLQQRIGYMRYDWEKYRNNEGGSYSDAQRWVSLEIGLRLWKTNPWLGIGVGDLPIEVQQTANDFYPNYSIEPRLPHNQFIYILTGTGLLGLLLSLTAFLSPFTLRAARRCYLFMAFQIMIFVSFLVEYTLETAIGTAFYLFFTLWFMRLGQVSEQTETAAPSV